MTAHYEPGYYEGKVTGQRFGVTANDKPFFEISFEPTKGPNLPDLIYERNARLYLSEAAFDRSVKTLRAMGWAGSALSELDPGKAGYTNLAGEEIALACEINDRGYEDWGVRASFDDKPKQPVTNDPSVAAKLDRLYGKKLKATAVAAPVGADEPYDPECPF